MKKVISLFCVLSISGFCFAQIPDTTLKQPAPTDSLKVQPVPAPPPQTTPATPPAAPAEPQQQKRSFNEKFAFGFGTGFWITPGTTYLELSPTLAYRFPRMLTTGIGFRYIYQHDRYRNNDLHSYGPNVFARVNLLKRVYFWTEYEHLFNQYFNESYAKDEYTRETDDTDAWFAGLGYVRSLGKKGRGGISFQVLYNILYENEDHSPYYSAFTYRVGYFF